VPRLSKLDRLTTCEERSTQDWESRIHQAHQQAAVQPTEGPNTWRKEWAISDPFRSEELAAAALRRLNPGKSAGLDSTFPEFILHAGLTLDSWFLRFPHFLFAPTQKSTDLEKSTNRPNCDPTAGKAIWGPKELSPYISYVRIFPKSRKTCVNKRKIFPWMGPVLSTLSKNWRKRLLQVTCT